MPEIKSRKIVLLFILFCFFTELAYNVIAILAVDVIELVEVDSQSEEKELDDNHPKDFSTLSSHSFCCNYFYKKSSSTISSNSQITYSSNFAQLPELPPEI